MATASTSTETPEEVKASTKKDMNSTANMDEELANLTSNFNGQVRVMEALRKDSYLKTVKINPNQLDIVFSFNLPRKYIHMYLYLLITL